MQLRWWESQGPDAFPAISDCNVGPAVTTTFDADDVNNNDDNDNDDDVDDDAENSESDDNWDLGDQEKFPIMEKHFNDTC